MGALQGRAVVITGAAGGLGKGIAERYVAEGARVCLGDVSEQVVAVAEGLGESATAVVADVSTWEGNQEIVAHAGAAFGRLDTLVCNAGVYDQAVALADIPGDRLADALHELFDVNVLGYALGVRAALPALLSARGSVVMTVSFAGSHASGGGVLYTASKHAVVGLVRQLAYELAPHVPVIGVSPGLVPTRLRGLRTLDQEAADSVLPGTGEALPTGIVPDAADYGALYTLAASPESAHLLTGTVLAAHSGLDVRGLARPAGGESLVNRKDHAHADHE